MDELNFNMDFDGFSEFEINLDDDFETRIMKPRKTKNVDEHHLKYSNAEKMARDITIETDSRYFAIINGSFCFGDFIEALIIEKKYEVDRLLISTLTLSENNVDSLHGLMSLGVVKSLDLIVSDYFFAHERQNLIPYIYECLDVQNRFQLAVAGTHCKICLIKTACGKRIVIHGSANLRSSSNIEQVCIEENQSLYDFNETYQNRIFDFYKTINKSIRGKELWHQVRHNIQGSTKAGPEKPDQAAKPAQRKERKTG